MILGLSNIKNFKAFFDVVLEYQDQVEIVANQTGVKISLLDNRRSGFYDVFYDKDFFSVFEVDGVEVATLFITDLNDILNTARKSETLIMESDDNFVTIKFEGDNGSRIFELVQAQNFTDNPPIPSIPMDCDFYLDVVDLDRTIKDMKIINDNGINIIYNGEEVVFSTTENAQTNYSHNIEVSGNGRAINKYSVTYLKDIPKFKEISSVVHLEFGGDNMPMKWTFEGSNMVVTGLIAPLIGVDEE